jgi:hypothetical protein
LVGGLNQLEFKVLIAQSVKPPMAFMLIQQLRIGSREGCIVCAEVLNELGKQSLMWQSDSGSVAPWRFEFYLRSVGIDEAAVGRVMPSFRADKPAPKAPATTQLMVERLTRGGCPQ